VFLLFELSLVLGAAKIGGLVAQKMRQPVVLGELVAGIILGNLTYLGIEFFEGIRNDPGLAILASTTQECC
jgi:Kef-type K+ transport system membrane component KefB